MLPPTPQFGRSRPRFGDARTRQLDGVLTEPGSSSDFVSGTVLRFSASLTPTMNSLTVAREAAIRHQANSPNRPSGGQLAERMHSIRSRRPCQAGNASTFKRGRRTILRVHIAKSALDGSTIHMEIAGPHRNPVSSAGTHSTLRLAQCTYDAADGFFGNRRRNVVPSGFRLTKSTLPPRYCSPNSFMVQPFEARGVLK